MENQTTSTSEQAAQPQSLNQSPSQQLPQQPQSLGYPSPLMVASHQERTAAAAPTQFLQDLVLQLLPNGRIASIQNNPSLTAQASSTTPQPVQTQTTPTSTLEEPQYWAGNEQVTQYLEENGINSVEDILQYTAGQEQQAEQYQEIFNYAMHPDPEIRAAFWENYQQALEGQGGNQPSAPQAPSFPGTPNNAYSQQYPNQQQFASLQQLDQAHRLMQSGLPGITPQQLAEFDRTVLNTPGHFWGQQIFNAGDI